MWTSVPFGTLLFIVARSRGAPGDGACQAIVSKDWFVSADILFFFVTWGLIN